MGQRGVEVQFTPDGTEGLRLAKAQTPDAIILCKELRRGSGYSVCNKIKKDPDLATIPLLLTSEDATDEEFDRHRKLKTHADHYLKKPFDLSDMEEWLSDHMSLGAAELEVLSDDLEEELDQDDVALESLESLEDDATRTNMNVLDAEIVEEEAEEVAAPEPLRRGTQTLLSDAQVDKLRAENRQLRQKAQQLESTLQEKELEFNDRLLEESSRARNAIDLKKRIQELEREIEDQKKTSQKASQQLDSMTSEVSQARRDKQESESERSVLSERIDQLTAKVQELVQERDEIEVQLNGVKAREEEIAAAQEHTEQVRKKASKAIDIALELINEAAAS